MVWSMLPRRASAAPAGPAPAAAAEARQRHLRRLQKQAHTPPLLPACPCCACVREEEQHVLAAMQDDPRYAFYRAPDAEDDAIFRSYKSQLCEQVRGGTF